MKILSHDYTRETKYSDRSNKENCALLGHYAASSGNFLSTFPDKQSIPFSGFKNSESFGSLFEP